MDKVIIDGIDVSECKFRLIRDNKQKCECCHATGFGVICNCESWYDCYYKQLKRLQAENERLKNDLNEAYEHYNFKRIHNEVINAENLKYCQALQEIREMATLFHSVNENKDLDRFKNNILDKINEVIGEE